MQLLQEINAQMDPLIYFLRLRSQSLAEQNKIDVYEKSLLDLSHHFQ